MNNLEEKSNMTEDLSRAEAKGWEMQKLSSQLWTVGTLIEMNGRFPWDAEKVKKILMDVSDSITNTLNQMEVPLDDNNK